MDYMNVQISEILVEHSKDIYSIIMYIITRVLDYK